MHVEDKFRSSELAHRFIYQNHIGRFMAIQLAAIGVGGHLATLELSQYAEMNDVDIVAGCDVSSEYRERFEGEYQAPAYASVKVLLDKHAEELDVVNIVTPHTLHYEQARICLERGLHVFVEKPMVTDIKHGVDLVRLADERDLVLQVGYQRHFHPGFVEMKRIIDSGRIGDIHMISTFLSQNWIEPFKDQWRTNPDLSGGGQLYDSGSHLLDSMLWTTQTRPRSVSAAMDQRDHDVDVNTAIAATLEREGQKQPVTASIGITGDGMYGAPKEALIIWGTNGRIGYTQDNGDRITVAEKDGREYVTEITENITQPPLTREKLKNFISAVKGECEPAVSGEFGLQVTAFTEAVYRATERGETVDVPEILEQQRVNTRAQR